MEIVLNGLELDSIQDVHREFARQADLPFYGSNLDALHGALTGMTERPPTIRWINAAESAQRFPKQMRAFEGVIAAIQEDEGIQHSSWPPRTYERSGGCS